jgi:hypothetical protein
MEWMLIGALIGLVWAMAWMEKHLSEENQNF